MSRTPITPAPPARSSISPRLAAASLAEAEEEIVLGYGSARSVPDPHERLPVHHLAKEVRTERQEKGVVCLAGVSRQAVVLGGWYSRRTRRPW